MMRALRTARDIAAELVLMIELPLLWIGGCGLVLILGAATGGGS